LALSDGILKSALKYLTGCDSFKEYISSCLICKVTIILTQHVRVAHSFDSSFGIYRYSALFETEGHLVTDSFHFSVSDMDHNRLDNQIFTITITPVENPPLVIAFADLITVKNPQINKQGVL
jgi:hypothetical protein